MRRRFGGLITLPRLLSVLGLAAALLAAIAVARSVHLTSRGPALGSSVALPSSAGTPQTGSLWPPCSTPRQRQEWAITVAQAQPNLLTLARTAPASGTGVLPASLQQAVREAGSVVVAQATQVQLAPVLDGTYVQIAVSTQLTLEQTVAGAPPASLNIGMGVLVPGALCQPVLEPIAGQVLLVPPVRVLLLLVGTQPEPVVGTYVLSDGGVTANFAGPFAQAVNGISEQDLINRIRALGQ